MTTLEKLIILSSKYHFNLMFLMNTASTVHYVPEFSYEPRWGQTKLRTS